MKDIIHIVYGELQTAVDGEVMKAVQQVGINVNKEELLKALELADKLVRCKDCIFWSNNICKAWGLYRVEYEDDFCSHGERKDK